MDEKTLLYMILSFLYMYYLRLIKSTGIKQSGINNLHWLFNERMLRHKEYFDKNNTIKESYNL